MEPIQRILRIRPDWEPHKRPQGFDGAFAALKHAIMGGRLRATIRTSARVWGWTEGWKSEGEVGVLMEEDDTQIIYQRTPDWRLTTVAVDDLKHWLRDRRGIKSGFFFQDADVAPYLNKSDEHYSPKLAAAFALCVEEPQNRQSCFGFVIMPIVMACRTMNRARKK